jgi:hypothetical protein
MAYRQQQRTIIIQSEPETHTESKNNLDLTKNEPDPDQGNDLKAVNIPPKYLYGNDLKRIKSFKKLRRGYKLQNQKAIFLNDLKELLRQFPTDQHRYDDELLIEILNIAESFFIYGNQTERETIKDECVKELMSPYFANDVDLLLKTITHVWQHVNKSSLRRRLWSRFKIFFFPK